MRTSQFPLNTIKEIPADAEIASHRLMLRAGLIRKLAAGLYSWLPLGLRVMRRVEQITRQEMERVGALELLMPALQPAELWQESGRWSEYGVELMRLTDRHQREFCLGPTHEEIITELVRHEVRSYKQLPIIYYQIQSKFRDEIRPRFGIMRAREFVMKDAYSFHRSEASLSEVYQQMYQAYSRILTRTGLNFRAVVADSGAIGGNLSHEFHVLADAGEDAIAFSTESDYATNVEMAEAVTLELPQEAPTEAMTTVATAQQHTIEEVACFLETTADRCLKTLLVKGAEDDVVALLLRGDHELNPVKAARLAAVATPLQFATTEEVIQTAGCEPGSIGPIGLDCPIIADRSAAQLVSFVCGANQRDTHYTNVNWTRDLPLPNAIEDIRNVEEGDPSPDGKGTLTIARGIEVGHIFQLGTKYSEAMGANVLDEQGHSETLIMGCYGIGISRIVAAAIEQHHDDRGICWPQAIAPFQVALLPMNMHKSERLRSAAEKLYRELVEAGVDLLFDDRKIRPGVMFADMELIGIPHRIVLGERGLDNGEVEYRARSESESRSLPINEIVPFLVRLLAL